MEIVRGLRRGLLPAVVKMMRRAIRNFGRRNWIRPTILLLTVCHLGRFYADAPLALAICFDHNHPALAAHHESVAALSASAATDHHSHNHAVAGKRASGVAGVPGVIVAHDATAPGADQGYKLEHCKDTWKGINLIPASVLSLPSDVAAIVPAQPSELLEFSSTQVYPNPSLAIFHPPQNLS